MKLRILGFLDFHISGFLDFFEIMGRGYAPS